MRDPLDSKTWSSGPSNLARALIAKGVDIVPFDSRVVGKSGKAIAAAWNLVRGLPVREIGRFAGVRALRRRAVAAAAEAAGVAHIICTSSIDATAPTDYPYSIWIHAPLHPLHPLQMAPGFTRPAPATRRK